MMLLSLLHEAWVSISASRLRTFLAVLGIIIGVASVVVMLAVGTGSQRAVEASINKLGSNLLIITPGARNNKGLQVADVSELSIKDAEAIATLSSIVAAAPITSPQTEQVSSGKNNWNTRITGTTPDYFLVRQWSLKDGNFFNGDDMRLSKRVAVIGATIEKKLFENAEAVGGTLRIKGMPFKVIGVLESKGQDFGGRDQDDTILVPITTAQNKLLGNQYWQGIVQAIYAQAASKEVMELATQEISELLRERFKLRETVADNFTIRNLTSITQTATDTSRALSMLLGAIASISLVVGGIGIMNIMLVTVAERTREIGIRKAIGASEKQIMIQFLLEAVLIAASGSAAGLAIGYGGGVLAGKYLDVPAEFSLWSVVLAIVVAVGVGVLSGLYPALKASRLQPIEALRAVGA